MIPDRRSRSLRAESCRSRLTPALPLPFPVGRVFILLYWIGFLKEALGESSASPRERRSSAAEERRGRSSVFC